MKSLQKGGDIGEDDDDDGVIDEEQDEFLMDYYTKFKINLKSYKDEFHTLKEMPK